MTKETIIKIRDTGYVKPDFSETETRFTDYSGASQINKRYGEFRVQGDISLKVLDVTSTMGKNKQNIAGIKDQRNKGNSISMNPLKLFLTCELLTPTDFNDNTETLDLPDLKDLMLMLMSRGHKDLYLTQSSTVKDLFWLQVFVETFGREDDPLEEGAFKHLNVDFTDMRFTHRVGNLAVQLEFDVLWDF